MRFVLRWSIGTCALAMGVACAGADDPATHAGGSTSGGAGAASTSSGTTSGTSTTASGSAGAGGASNGATATSGTATGTGGTNGTGTGGAGSGGGGPADSGAAGPPTTADGGTAPRKIGGGCKSDGDCDTTLGLHCDLTLPGGMCTKACTADLDCGMTTLMGQRAANACVMSECYRGCSTAVPCTVRTGYSCVGADPRRFCGTALTDGGR
ncbi:MAG: hypothetical protein QOE09_1913 [Ilumatobacteraceae bacterium]